MKKIFTILFIITFCLKGIAQFPGFAYMQSITVSNTSTTTAIDCQIKLTINTQSLITASQMLANGDDIRFVKTCNGPTQYNYWIESGINTPTTSIWVKIDTIVSGGSRTFMMAYGNSTATPVSSIPLTFNFAGSSTDSVASGTTGGVVNSQRGFRFSPNTDILVTSFGKREPTGTDRYVTLFDNTSTSIIAQQQVSGPAAAYSYSALPNPIWLTQGTQYVIQLFQGSADGYYFGTSSQIDSRLTYYEMMYCNTCTQNTFPTSTLSNMHYGYADFLFYYKNSVTPAPTYSLSPSVIPSLNIIAPSFTPCAGSNLNLSVSGATTYTWSTGVNTTSIIVSPTITTTYSVSGTLNQCIDSKTILISVNPNPIVTVNSGSICLGNSFTITPNGATTYSYSGGSSVVSPSVTTSYSVIGTNSVGCSATVISTVNVNSCVGVIELDNNSTVSIFPNPTNGILNINFTNSLESNISVSVSNAIGQIVLNEKLNSSKTTLNIKQLPTGMYFINIIKDNKVLGIQKIIKE